MAMPVSTMLPLTRWAISARRASLLSPSSSLAEILKKENDRYREVLAQSEGDRARITTRADRMLFV